MDSIDLCSGSEAGESPRRDILPEYDFVGSLTNSPAEELNNPIVHRLQHADKTDLSNSSEDTLPWKRSPTGRAQHNMSDSSDEDITHKPNLEPGIISLDSEDENIPRIPSSNCVSTDLKHYFSKNSPIDDLNFDFPLNIPCTSKFADARVVTSALRTQSSSGVSSMDSQESKRRSRSRRTNDEKENEQRNKMQRKRMLAMLKALKPGDCMKYMTMVCCNELVQSDCFSRVAETVGANGVLVSPVGSTSCVTWTRRIPPHLQDQQGQLGLSPLMSDEPHTVIVLQQPLAVNLLMKRSLSAHLKSVLKNRTLGTHTLILYGMEIYLRKHRNKNNAKWKENIGGGCQTSKGGFTEPHITDNDLEYYLTKLLLNEGISSCRAETPEELAQILSGFTKAIAEAPFKKEKYEKDQQAEFYMRGDNRDCVKVDANGNGLLRLWSQSLCKFPLTGLEVGQAVCDKWKSPRALCERLDTAHCGTEGAIAVLADVPIRRDKGPMAGTRRLGPELAKKLHIYFTATDGDTLLS